MRLTRIVMLAAVIAAVAAPASAQTSAEVGFGATFLHAAGSCTSCDAELQKGAAFDVMIPVNARSGAVIGIVGDFTFATEDPDSTQMYQIGFRAMAVSGPIHPFGQFMLGLAHLSGGSTSSNDLVFTFGGGLDFPINRVWNVRVQFDVPTVQYGQGNGHDTELRYLAGLAVRF
jgi:hypothetical protein